MNFSPFGNPFPASISGIHQFTAGAVQVRLRLKYIFYLFIVWVQNIFLQNTHHSFERQDPSNRYHTSSASTNVTNMNHCNQTNVPKFRGDDNLSASAMTQKYNGHGNSIPNVSNNPYQANVHNFSSSAHLHSNGDDKQRLTNSYQQSNTSSNLHIHQSQPELSQEICNALLNQQTDAKRGKCSVSCSFYLSPRSVICFFVSFL